LNKDKIRMFQRRIIHSIARVVMRLHSLCISYIRQCPQILDNYCVMRDRVQPRVQDRKIEKEEEINPRDIFCSLSVQLLSLQFQV
jgi:hypothetical protein